MTESGFGRRASSLGNREFDNTVYSVCVQCMLLENMGCIRIYVHKKRQTTNKKGGEDNYAPKRKGFSVLSLEKKKRKLSFFGTPEGKKRVHLPTPHNVLPQLKKKKGGGEKRKK